MTLPADQHLGEPGGPAPLAPQRPRRSRAQTVGWWSLALSLVILAVLAFSPTPFVIQQPGPVFNVLGTVDTDGDSSTDEEPLIDISGTDTYDVSDTLDMLTVSLVGNPDQTPNWFEIAAAYFDPSKAVMPLEAYFPSGTTTEEREAANEAEMVDSQQEAVAAALTSLGISYDSSVVVGSVSEGTPADGVFQAGDVVVSANGEAVTSLDQLKSIIADNGDKAAIAFVVDRDGETVDLDVTPAEASYSDGTTGYVVGIATTTDFDFPFDVTIKLDDVGGPSAGMMFALGIIDRLTPGALAGDAAVAGTGTIDESGTVGAIGGIRQKLYAARDAGADFFLAPADNCGDVVGHVPDGIRVFEVATLDDSLAVLEALADGGDLDALPTCE